jgi:UDP-N-acetylmuramoylalanine--D-glutamate ligase
VIRIPDVAGRDYAVFGLARTGLAAARALMASGARVHAWDENEAARQAAEAAGIPLSDINARDWRSFAALVLSPGIPLHFPRPHRIVDLARQVGTPILGDMELFALALAALQPGARPKVVGITGTNGKSTTTALIGHILQHGGKDVRVGGNIGAAVLDLPPLHAGAVYVLELSSYQLDLVESLRCDVSVLLNLTPDHLDRHGSLQAYLAAKKRIFANQGAGDWAVVGVDTPDTAVVCTALIASGARRVAPISAKQAVGRGVCTIAGQVYDGLDGRAEPVADLANAPALQGRHNGQNAAAAYAAARAFGMSPRAIAEAMATFPGLPHRMENAGSVAGVRFINDSKATNSDSAAQALALHPGAFWIAGGAPKAGGIEGLAHVFPQLSGAFLYGEAAPSFAATLEGRTPIHISPDLAGAVVAAFEAARVSGASSPVVLFSPACASFDQFRDFEHRGDVFKEVVGALARMASSERAST